MKTTFNRRTFTATTGLIVSTILSGCLDTTDETPVTELSASRTIDSWNYEVCETAPSIDTTDLDADDHSHVHHITSSDSANTALTTESHSDDNQEIVDEFIDNTDFESALLIHIETRAPNGCHSLHVNSLSISDSSVLVGSVESENAAESDMCSMAVVEPSLLIRVTAEPSLPTHAELDVTDGWGDTKPHVSSPPMDGDFPLER